MGERLKHLIPKKYHKMVDMDWVMTRNDYPASGMWILDAAPGYCFGREGKHTAYVTVDRPPDIDGIETTLKDALHSLFPCHCEDCNEETHDENMQELTQSTINDGLLPTKEEMLAKSKDCATIYSAEDRLAIILEFIHEARRISKTDGFSIEVSVHGEDDSLHVTEFDNRKMLPDVIDNEMVTFGKAWTDRHLEKVRNILKHCAKSNGLSG